MLEEIKVIQSIKGEKQSSVLPALNPVSYDNGQVSKTYYWCNSGMDIMGVTNHFLTGFKSCATRLNPNLAPRICG